MKKIPTLFTRKFENHKVVGITPEVTEGMDWVLNGEGIATVKIDGSCCAIINGEFYKRYDAKKGKPIPDGAIKCQDEPDPVTGHLPCWVKCDRNNPSDKWFWKAYDQTISECYGFKSLEPYDQTASLSGLFKACENAVAKATIKLEDGTYEAIGKHFNGNHYDLDYDKLVRHGVEEIDVPRTFEGIRDFLEKNNIEGIVFWKDGEPKCKIKRSDFGFTW